MSRLSDRIRAGSEAAPWVVSAVEDLEANWARCSATCARMQTERDAALAAVIEWEARWAHAAAQAAGENQEIEQTLGRLLGYPWFKDDQKNFPGATEADGVCVGEHVPVTLVKEAARLIETLRARLGE